MALPSVNVALIDPGALGQPVSTDQIPIYVGVAADGPLYEVRTFSRLDRINALYTLGHLVDVAAAALASGAPSVKLMRIEDTVPGDIAGEDSAESLIITTVTGTPLQFLAVRIEVVTGGSAISSGNVVVKYSLDNWEIPFVESTFSANIKVPNSGTISLDGTGLTVTLATGQTPAAGDFAVFSVTPGHYSATEVALATDALRSPLAGDYTTVVYTGEDATAAGANTLASAIDGQVAELFSEARFIDALTGAGLGADTTVITAFASTAADPPFLSVGYAAAYVQNSRSQQGRGRVGLREHEVAAIRISGSLVSTDPGRTASGPLGRVVGTDYDARLEGPALHDARIATLRTWDPAAIGVFIARQRMLVSLDSNFVSWQFAAVMIVALRAAHRVGFSLILESMRRTAAGTLDPRDAKDIEGAMLAEIERVLLAPLNVRGTQGHISAAGVSVSLTTPLPAIDVDIKIRPLGWPDELNFTLQYADEVA